MEDLKLLRNRISELQAEITKLKSSKKFVVRYVDSITIPQQLDVNTFYINKTTNQFGTWSEITRDFDWIDIGGSGYSFDDIASFFVGGTDIGITVDSALETITIAYTGTPSVNLWETEDTTHIKQTDSKSTYIERIDPTASAELTTISDTDKFSFWTTVWKRITWSNIKATLKTYFDTLYSPITPKLNVDYFVKNFAGQLYGMALKCPTLSVTGRLIVCENSAVNIYDIDLLGNVIQSSKTTIVTVTTGCACYVPELDQFWVIQRLGDTIYRIDATNKTLTSTLTGLATATTVDRHCFEYYNGYVYFQRGAYSTGISRINVTTDAVTSTVNGQFCAYGFEYNGTKYIATMAQVATTGLIILLESDLSVYNNPNVQGLNQYHKIIFYNNKLYIYSDYYIASATQVNHITKIFNMATLTYEADVNNCMISPCLVDSKYVIGKTNYAESTLILRDLSTYKVIATLNRDTTTNISIQPFCYCPITKTIYYCHQNATAGNNSVATIKIY